MIAFAVGMLPLLTVDNSQYFTGNYASQPSAV